MEDATDSESGHFSRERLAGYDESILARRILLVGAGALGEAIALQLTMWGFARATVVDFDAYEASNATRVLDFPHADVRAGKAVYKSEHVVSRWRRRLANTGLACDDLEAVVGYAQELGARQWHAADVVVGAVDHPRARHDVAMLARRYGKPLLMGGFDAVSKGVTVEHYPAEHAAACHRCTLGEEPSYAAVETSCTATGRRALEARRVPATPTLAAACASVIVQRLVDGLVDGFASTASVTQLALAARPGTSAGMHLAVERDPACPMHEDHETLTLAPDGDTLGALLAALDIASPGAVVSVPGGVPIYVVADDADVLLRLAVPAWRCPTVVRAAAFPHAPPGASSLVLGEIDARLADRFGLDALPMAAFGLGPGARFGVVGSDGRARNGVWHA